MPHQSNGALAKCRSNAKLVQVRILQDKLEVSRTSHRQGRNPSRPQEDIRHPKKDAARNITLVLRFMAMINQFTRPTALALYYTHKPTQKYPLTHTLLDWGQYYCSRVVTTTAGNQSPVHPNPCRKRNYATPRLKRKH